MRRAQADTAAAPQNLTTASSQSSAFAVADSTDATQAIPKTAWWGASIVGYLHTIAGGAATITFSLCTDAAGDEPFTPEYTATIAVGRTAATDGSVSVAIDCSFVFPDSTLYYVLARTDAGTAKAHWQLHFAPRG
jgi:hypothetical protein